MRRFVSIVMLGFAALTSAGESAPEGNFENSACLECHRTRDAELVSAWRAGVHGAAGNTVTCVRCHGSAHEGAASRARRDDICAGCHGGALDPVVHSYATSKHGVIMHLEKDDWDWSRPLASANYRAPGCAYCHMHNGNHDVGKGVRVWDPIADSGAVERERVHAGMRMVCRSCHSPRYIARLLDNGERMLNIGRMKVREAAALIEQAGGDFSETALAEAKRYFSKMQSSHLKNLYLGVGHQSPDYQWWHGQPALDGDLLRIKSTVGELYRVRAIENSEGAD